MHHRDAEEIRRIEESIRGLWGAVDRLRPLLAFPAVVASTNSEELNTAANLVVRLQQDLADQLVSVFGSDWGRALDVESPEKLSASCRSEFDQLEERRSSERSRRFLGDLGGVLRQYRVRLPYRSLQSAAEQTLQLAVDECLKLGEVYDGPSLPQDATNPTATVEAWRSCGRERLRELEEAWRAVSTSLANVVELANHLTLEESMPTGAVALGACPVLSEDKALASSSAVALGEADAQMAAFEGGTRAAEASNGRDLEDASTLAETVRYDPISAVEKPSLTGNADESKTLVSDGDAPTSSSEQVREDLANSEHAPALANQGGGVQGAEAASWRALSRNLPSLAYHILKSAKEVSPAWLGLPPALAELVLFESLYVRSPTGLAEAYGKATAEFLNWTATPESESVGAAPRLVALASALRPALVAVDSTPSDLLSPLPGLDAVWPELERVRASVVELTATHASVDVSVLRGVSEHAEWATRRDAMLGELAAWLKSEQSGKLIYGPTTEVWHTWLGPDGYFGAVIRGICEGKGGSTSQLRSFIQWWSQKSHIEKKLAETDSELRKMGAKRRPIEARAKQAVKRKVDDAVLRLDEWSRLLESEPGKLNGHVEKHIEECREAVQKASADDEGREALSSWLSTQPHGREAAEVTLRMLDRVRDLFYETAPTNNRQREEDPQDARDADLCWVPQSLDLCSDRSGQLRSLIETAESNRPAGSVFADHIASGRHVAAEQLLSRMKADGEPANAVESLQAELDDSRKKYRVILYSEVQKAVDDIDSAVRLDMLNEEDRDRHIVAIELSRAELESVANAPRTIDRLQKIREEIAHQRRIRVEELAAEVKLLRDDAQRCDSSPSYLEDLKEVERVLKEGDYVTAAEYIEIVKQGDEIGRDPQRHMEPFAEFFPGFLGEYSDWMGQSELNSVNKQFVENARRGQPLGPMRFDAMTEPRRTESCALLDAWRKMRASNELTHLKVFLRDFFAQLGLREIELDEPHRKGRQADWEVQLSCDPLRNRNICIVPRFGSEADGEYLVLGLRGQPTVPDLTTRVDKASLRKPTIVLYFGRLNETDRRELAQCRPDSDRSFLVIDEALVAFLAMTPEARLHAFFSCTLPFACSQPFTDTASTVPPEMFFGRKREFDAILQSNGTNLVYGGRQLGKSVLLREVANRRHDPAAGIVVVWVDLKNRGVGTTRSPGDLWSVIGEELRRSGVLERDASTAPRISERVKEWITAKSGRKVVLLLDEADAFLEQDSKPSAPGVAAFPVVSELKGLMDDTNRAFKVVFAGLHNVQRAARDPNTPIAHLGTPVNIGPMYEEKQWREAKRLVEDPLAQMGYRFESPELSMRILSHTNFYPSLIQVFCKHLVSDLQESRGKLNYSKVPPYSIRATDIDRVYGDPSLQAEIRKRFELTLLLDNRYRVIALVVALASIEARSEGDSAVAVVGYPVRWIREQSLGWWREGFADDNSHEQFRILVDEMVGLGILRPSGSDAYRLRSNNTLRLLGSQFEIEEKLQDAAQEPPPAPYEASTFRRIFGKDTSKLSPLTASQEADLLDRSNGVCIVSGCFLTDTEEFYPAVEALSSHDVSVCRLADAESPKHFSLRLLEVDTARGDGLTICVVAMPWHVDAVRAAEKMISQKSSSKRSFLRIVFPADPSHLWRWMAAPRAPTKVVEIQLRPWQKVTLKRWLTDQGYGDRAINDDGLAEIMAQTGGWPLAIEQLHHHCKKRPHEWKNVLRQIPECFDINPSAVKQETPREAFAALQSIAIDWGLEPFEQDALPEILEEQVEELNIAVFVEWTERLGWVRWSSLDDLSQIDGLLGQLIRKARGS